MNQSTFLFWQLPHREWRSSHSILRLQHSGLSRRVGPQSGLACQIEGAPAFFGPSLAIVASGHADSVCGGLQAPGLRSENEVGPARVRVTGWTRMGTWVAFRSVARARPSRSLHALAEGVNSMRWGMSWPPSTLSLALSSPSLHQTWDGATLHQHRAPDVEIPRHLIAVRHQVPLSPHVQ